MSKLQNPLALALQGCGVAATVTLLLFLIGIIGIIIEVLQPTTTNSWFTQFVNNWLVVLFKMNTRFSGIQPGLSVLNLLDIVIMFLFGTVLLARSTLHLSAPANFGH